jgi:hypothetical protein
MDFVEVDGLQKCTKMGQVGVGVSGDATKLLE